MKANRGVAGEAMVKYVLANRAEINKEVRQVANDLVREIPDQKYRFYRAHAACSLTMARIAKELGIIEFDIDRLREFTVGMLLELTD